MLKELKFVQGAVAKKDFIPAMTHFAIENGHVRSWNGSIALSSPLQFDIDCKPKADKLVHAIANCHETIQLSMTPTGKLRIISGPFRALIDCVHEETAHVEPEGEMVALDGAAILEGMRKVQPFIADDASRPWSNGVLLKDESIFATNNVILVEYWIGVRSPITLNIPRQAVREMVRIGEPPTHCQLSDHSISFHYSDGRWIRSNLLDLQGMPDFAPVLNLECEPTPVEEGLFDAVESLRPFTDKMGRVFIGAGQMRTAPIDTEEGAAFELAEVEWEGIYNIEMLKLLKGVAKEMDMRHYPRPCMFFGDRLRGAIIGMKI